MEKPEDSSKSQATKAKKQKVEIVDDGDKKDERSPAARIQDAILAACQAKSQGITQEELVKNAKITPEELPLMTSSINALLGQGLLSVGKTAAGAIAFIIVSSEEAAKFRGLNADERLIYQLVEESGNNGIWIKYLRSRSNIASTRIPKILSTLERRKLIKGVKTADKKKVYMLFDLEPPHKTDFPPEKVAILAKRLEDYITLKGYAKLDELATYLKSSGSLADELSGKMDLTNDDVQNLLDTLVYDGKVEEYQDPREQQRGRRTTAVLYRPIKMTVSSNGLTEVPCGVCPVFDKCSDNGDITPQNCVYLKAWFEF